MRATIFLPPNRRVESGSTVVVLRKVPDRSFIREQVHVQSPATSAGTNHGRLFEEAVVLYDIKNLSL